ncbi:hypothetical protein V8E54_004172 [Elaphomyces granulatus]
MDHQEILPKRKRADTIAQVADESQENLQNERLQNVAQFGIPPQLSDDDSSDEDYDNFWKDQKVIVGGRLAKPTSEQMRHSPFPPSDRKPYTSKTNVNTAPSGRTERRRRKERADRLDQLLHFTPTVPKKQIKLSFGTIQAAPTVTQAAPVATPTPAAPVAFVEEYNERKSPSLIH